ncbi:MAG TPA: hypothetical protein VEW71_02860 [Allosphingosinicella sp.]|nr:hypothetical protein [Allosphingosinicella sp.]
MTFEGFDVAPLIETMGFSPTMAVPDEPNAVTLDAALRELVRAERASARAEATLLDLWIDRAGGSNLRALELPALGAGTSRHAWALMADGGGVLDLSGGGIKDYALSAALGEEEDDSPTIVVVGPRVDEGDDDGGWTGSGYGGGSYGDSSHEAGGLGEGGPTLQPGEKPSCATSNEITNKDAPDGVGKYYAPEGVTSAYLNAALGHIVGLSNNNPANRFAVMAEIIDMYTNPDHPHFVDFKDWGSPTDGPDGSVGVNWRYFSDARGSFVDGSLFEPFGNYFFGMLCTYGGLSPEEIYAAAAWYSESGPFWEGDDPQDIPHVQKGIADAQTRIAGNETPIQVQAQCG